MNSRIIKFRDKEIEIKYNMRVAINTSKIENDKELDMEMGAKILQCFLNTTQLYENITTNEVLEGFYTIEDYTDAVNKATDLIEESNKKK